WAPAYVADQLRDAHQVAETSRRDAVLGAAELATATDPPPDAATRVDAVYTAAETADRASVRAGELERVRAARAGWAETVAEVEQRARLAAEELTRRELPPPSSMSQDGQVDRGHDLMSGGSVSTGTRGRVDDADAGHGPGTAVAQPWAAGSVGRDGEPGASQVWTIEGGRHGGGSTSTAADIDRIQQHTRDTLAGIRSRARESALERLRGEAVASVQRWRDRRFDHTDTHDLTPDPDPGHGSGLDRDPTSHEAAIDLD
ncbi:MAG: hypothetical protein QOG20_5734, partial [Pseudonocardiales bacterium]|nr:hypothetical protein [Pseudonocardiales bacterium]